MQGTDKPFSVSVIFYLLSCDPSNTNPQTAVSGPEL